MSPDLVCPDDFTACFTVHAAADPGTLPRVIEPFAKRGLIPSIIHSHLSQTVPPLMVVDVQIRDIDRILAENIAESLRQSVVVERVLLARMPAIAAAGAAS